MFLSARWRGEKNKIKAVFKLQVHATQVGDDDPLTLSVIPEDIGKPTVTLVKGLVRDGSCYWENPIYETVKFTREVKTGKINEKIYRFVLSKGSLKASVLGEISIDFANYAMSSTNVSSLSLPLTSTKPATVLHVKIQRVLENDPLRDINDSDEHARVNTKSLKTQFSINETENNIKTELIEEKTVEQIDIISSGSNSSLDTLKEFQSKTNNDIQEERQISQWEWLRTDSIPETCTDDSSNSPREIISEETSHEAIINKLKVEVSDLSRQSSISELELQSLRKQIMKECKKGQDLSKEIAMLREERDELKKEVTQYKSFRDRLDQLKAKDKLNFVEGDPWNLLGQLREELQYEKDLNSNLEVQLQKTQDSNSELILAIQELEDSLQHKNLSTDNLTVLSVKEMKENESKSGMNSEDDEEQMELEKLVMKNQVGCTESDLLDQKITELQIYQKDKDELEMQMEQLELDYEILKQENHDLSYKLEQNELQEQLKIQYECSSYSIITELETELKKQSEQLSKHELHIQNLEEEMEKMTEIFEADIEIISQSKTDQEKRAIKAEEALRKMKIQNVNTAEKLQEEFRRLSTQMASTFDTNEKLAAKAITEANQLRFQKLHLEEMLQNAKEELQYVKNDFERLKMTQKEDNLEALLDKWNMERNEMEAMVASLREEADKSIVRSANIMLNLKEEMKTLKQEMQNKTDGLKSESAFVSNLKQRIKLFEDQIKLKEVAIERSEKSFLGKEKDLLNKIKELERQVEEEINQTGIKVATKENKAMEEELKEMQTRYYELSVRLAEVEGEKQKLMMTVRTLKTQTRRQ